MSARLRYNISACRAHRADAEVGDLSFLQCYCLLGSGFRRDFIIQLLRCSRFFWYLSINTCPIKALSPPLVLSLSSFGVSMWGNRQRLCIPTWFDEMTTLVARADLVPMAHVAGLLAIVATARLIVVQDARQIVMQPRSVVNLHLPQARHAL